MALPNGNYQQRTRLNVVDSDATVLLYSDFLTSGTRLTCDLCELLNRPCIVISARETPDPYAAADAVLKFIQDNGIEVLNVGGPRASGWPAGYGFSRAVIAEVIKKETAELISTRRGVDAYG
jgi:hypothetical protein